VTAGRDCEHDAEAHSAASRAATADLAEWPGSRRAGIPPFIAAIVFAGLGRCNKVFRAV
jgi:hypothetical protein